MDSLTVTFIAPLTAFTALVFFCFCLFFLGFPLGGFLCYTLCGTSIILFSRLVVIYEIRFRRVANDVHAPIRAPTSIHEVLAV